MSFSEFWYWNIKPRFWKIVALIFLVAIISTVIAIATYIPPVPHGAGLCYTDLNSNIMHCFT
jgi:hypothetical protein